MTEVGSGAVVARLQAAAAAQQTSVDAARAVAKDAQPIPSSPPATEPAPEPEVPSDGH